MAVQGAILVPYSSVWQIVESRSWRRISYSEAIGLADVVDTTVQVQAVAQQ